MASVQVHEGECRMDFFTSLKEDPYCEGLQKVVEATVAQVPAEMTIVVCIISSGVAKVGIHPDHEDYRNHFKLQLTSPARNWKEDANSTLRALRNVAMDRWLKYAVARNKSHTTRTWGDRLFQIVNEDQ